MTKKKTSPYIDNNKKETLATDMHNNTNISKNTNTIQLMQFSVHDDECGASPTSLQQAATAMLAQANSGQQGLLQLIS